MVREGDVIFFDNGLEMATLIALIPDEINFTGICYSHNVFLALRQKKMPLPYCVAVNIDLKVILFTVLPNPAYSTRSILKSFYFRLRHSYQLWGNLL